METEKIRRLRRGRRLFGHSVEKLVAIRSRLGQSQSGWEPISRLGQSQEELQSMVCGSQNRPCSGEVPFDEFAWIFDTSVIMLINVRRVTYSIVVVPGSGAGNDRQMEQLGRLPPNTRN